VIWPANQADKQDNLANKGTIGNLRGLKLTLLKEQGIRKTNTRARHFERGHDKTLCHCESAMAWPPILKGRNVPPSP
jgi:hypothetical protein